MMSPLTVVFEAPINNPSAQQVPPLLFSAFCPFSSMSSTASVPVLNVLRFAPGWV